MVKSTEKKVILNNSLITADLARLWVNQNIQGNYRELIIAYFFEHLKLSDYVDSQGKVKLSKLSEVEYTKIWNYVNDKKKIAKTSLASHVAFLIYSGLLLTTITHTKRGKERFLKPTEKAVWCHIYCQLKDSL